MAPQRILLLLTLLLAAPLVPGQQGPANPGLEEGEPGQPPPGWFVPGMLEQAGCRALLDRADPSEGEQCVRVEPPPPGAGMGNLMQAFPARPYQGRRVTLRAQVRVEGEGTRAQLWIRVDRPGGRRGFFDNMGDRPVTGRSWTSCALTGDVEVDAEWINVGLLVFGAGRAWLDAVSLEVLGEAGTGNQPPSPLSEEGRASLEALARLLAYVRFFHPSDGAAATDWERFAIGAVPLVEACRTPEERVAALDRLFRPLAPAVSIYLTSSEAPQDRPETQVPRGRKPVGLVAWSHSGVGLSSSQDSGSVYSSRRVEERLRGNRKPREVAPLGTAVTAELPGGISARIPLTLQYDRKETLPPAEGALELPEPAAGWSPSGDDRSTRLANVMLAWGVFQHFYPYFEVVDTDWDAALSEALTRAAEDPDGKACLATLQRLVAALHDGHGNVFHPGYQPDFALPLALDWIEEAVVVTATAEGSPAKMGDAIVRIAGRPVAEELARLEDRISGATEGWRRRRALGNLLRRESVEPVPLELVGIDGQRRQVTLTPVAAGQGPRQHRPEPITEVRPGVWYVDLGRITDEDFAGAVRDLSRARGIVFDLRGYPSRLSTVVLAHLIDEPVTCAQWHIPQVTRPDREGMEFSFSNWPVRPLAPRFRGKAAFLTGPGAISYAETYMGIVENYHLAEIVGQTTAGTNGNVNPFDLPGGYKVIWTGMKVLKHDGSQHHGVGIQPTVPVSRTRSGVAAGLDEVLERGIQVVTD